MKTTEAARLLGVSQPTILAMIDGGDISAEKVKAPGRKGWRYEITDSEVSRYHLERAEKKNGGRASQACRVPAVKMDRKPAGSPAPGNLPTPKDGSGIDEQTIEDVSNISGQLEELLRLPKTEAVRLASALRLFQKADAETIVKVEDARRKMRENIRAEGEYISLSELDEQLDHVFAEFGRAISDLISGWQIEFDLPAQCADKMSRDYQRAAAATLKKIQRMVK